SVWSLTFLSDPIALPTWMSLTRIGEVATATLAVGVPRAVGAAAAVLFFLLHAAIAPITSNAAANALTRAIGFCMTGFLAKRREWLAAGPYDADPDLESCRRWRRESFSICWRRHRNAWRSCSGCRRFSQRRSGHRRPLSRIRRY